MGVRIDGQSKLASFRLIAGAVTDTARRELRVYHPDGVLSVIYVTAFESDSEAIYEAEKIARYGYQVDVWRDETRVDQVSELSNLDRSEHQ